ncbi:clasp N terminal-domain-containing protein [Mycotypha africana]|uniref:clasp N terminal-domain-containing protein n=1 Tax=Mycotypha africana TaxID=64632 RepID=UPI002300D24F|nr:clasp N terminal-domain-containing protein [Mycotypha africana]KAI8975170.1 clasp N terminal-domain-containing protein [Mycotypha africana]
MTIHKDDATSDVDPIQIHSVKELDNEFTFMLKAYADKETEFNWEARERALTRMKGLLRGNATEPPYLEVFIPYMRQMIDGIIKAVESLRTQLAVKALSVVGDIGVYIGKHLDSYMTDQIMMCMMRCASLTKKLVANACLEATTLFLKHTPFHSKVMNMLHLSINEKNHQVRLYTIIYTKVLLQAHTHRDNVRALMDRSGATDHFETILTKGLNDATPSVKEACREAFWIFWEHWRARGEHILKNLPPAAQKQLEKSKSTSLKTNVSATANRSLLRSNSPTMLPRASSSLDRRENSLHLSPSNSNTSNGSTSSIDYQKHLKRSASPRATSPRAMSPRAMSPHLRAYASPPPASISSQLTQHPSTSTSPTGRKTRVPTLSRKKSTIGFLKKAKPHFMALLTHDDPAQYNEGLLQLSKKLSAFRYQPDAQQLLLALKTTLQLEVPHAPPVNGETLKNIVAHHWHQGDSYSILYSWEGLTHILFKLFTFEELIPKLMLDANKGGELEATTYSHRLLHQPPSYPRSNTTMEHEAQLGLARAKLFLYHEHPHLAETVFANLIHYGGFMNSIQNSSHSPNNSSSSSSKKDITRLPANRRKLTKEFIEWMDDLVKPLIGLVSSSTHSPPSKVVDDLRLSTSLSSASSSSSSTTTTTTTITTTAPPSSIIVPEYLEGVPKDYINAYKSTSSSSSTSSSIIWFRSEDNLRQCLAILLPLITTSTSGTLWYAPLVTFLKHLRLLNQQLFEAVVSTYDEYSINKIARVLSIQIRPAIAVPVDSQPMHPSSPETFAAMTPSESIEPPKQERKDAMITDANTADHNNNNGRTISSATDMNNDLSIHSISPVAASSTHDSSELVADETFLLDTLHLNPRSNPPEQKKEEEGTRFDLEHSQNTMAAVRNVEQTASFYTEEHQQPFLPELQQSAHTLSAAAGPAAIAAKQTIELSKEDGTTDDYFDTVTQMKQQHQTTRAVGLVSAAIADPTPTHTLFVDESNPLKLSETVANLHTQHDLYEHEDPEVVMDLHTVSDLPSIDHQQQPQQQQPQLQQLQSPQLTEQQQQQQHVPTKPKQIILKASVPNPEKYPEPHYVPFYAPERVNFPNPVFQQPIRSNIQSNYPAVMMSSSAQTSAASSVPDAASNSPPPPPPSSHQGRNNVKDKTVLLYALMDKLKSHESNMSYTCHHVTATAMQEQQQNMTSITTTLRKLTRLFREVPIRRRWDQGGLEEVGSETWAGGLQGEASNFVEVIQTILLFLNEEPHPQPQEPLTNSHKEDVDHEESPVLAGVDETLRQRQQKIILVALESVRQLAVTQAGLFRFYERKVDNEGKTLESQLMEKLLHIRSSENPTVCIAAEDALDAVLGTLNPPTVFEMLMAYVVYRLVISPSIQLSADARYHPVGSAFTYLSKWVKELNDNFYIDEWLTSRGGVNAFFKGINHPMINVRKSCIEALVAFHNILEDELYMFFTDLREDQMALLKHYVTKASKKKAAIATTAQSIAAATAAATMSPMMIKRENAMTPTILY